MNKNNYIRQNIFEIKKEIVKGVIILSHTRIFPQSAKLLDKLKYEVAQELGINTPNDEYWGNMTTRDVGRIGGTMTRKLVALAERTLYQDIK